MCIFIIKLITIMNNNIHEMFEMMKKLNSDFNLNEDSFGQFNTSFEDPAQETLPKNGDVKGYNAASEKAKTLNTKSEKINTRVEFPEAFKTWFNNLGYSPEKRNITISMVITEIKKIMQEMGYK